MARPEAVSLVATSRYELLPLKNLDEQDRALPAGLTVTITVSPKKGMDATVAAAERLAGRGLKVVPHFSARLVGSPDHLRSLLGRIRDAGMEDVFVIGGDASEPIGPYPYALDVLRAMDDLGIRPARIGIGAYPEGHPLAGEAALTAALLAKQPLADYLVTQICFDARRIATWLGGVRAQGVALPLYVGVPGPVERTKLATISLQVGVGQSIRFLAKQGGMIARLMRARTYRPDTLVDGVVGLVGRPGGFAEGDLLGFHVYTFNQVAATMAWRERITGGT